MPFLTPGAGIWGYLSLSERQEIAVLLTRGSRMREIARRLGGAPSMISRAFQLDAAIRTGQPEYRASAAQTHADGRSRSEAGEARCQPRVADIYAGPARRICAAVRWERRGSAGRLGRATSETAKGPAFGEVWSSEQIAGRMRVDFLDDESMRFSHEAIYQSVCVQGGEGSRPELTASLRTGGACGFPGPGRRGASGAANRSCHTVRHSLATLGEVNAGPTGVRSPRNAGEWAALPDLPVVVA